MRREPEHQALIAVVWAGACGAAGAAARWEQCLGCGDVRGTGAAWSSVHGELLPMGCRERSRR